MTARTSISKNALAGDTWRRLFAFFISTRGQRDRVLKGLGLTPNDSRALYSLETGIGKPMRSLANEWGCDASNATWMVDRLERRGLAERRVIPTDRRVKMVVLTRLGARVRANLQRRLNEPPPELLELDREDLEALRDALAKIPRRSSL